MAAQSQIQGQVTDALLRALPGALVEVLEGTDIRTRIVTDAEGQFTVIGTARVNSALTLRASKDGYQTVTVSTNWMPLGNVPPVRLRMPGLEPSGVLGAGDYMLTLGIDLEAARSRIAAAPCPGFPVELASRTYDARITEGQADVRDVSATGAGVRGANFSMFLAGDLVVFEVGDDGILEDLPGFRYLTVWAGALPSDPRQVTSGASISIPVTGEFRYCELRSARGIYNDCSQVPGDQVLEYHSCTSDRVTMTLTRR